MTKSFPSMRVAALTLGIAFVSTGLVAPEPVFAKAANNLRCKGCVGARDLGKKAVRSRHIRNGAVTNSKIGDNAVGGSKIQSNSITSSKIKNGDIDPEDLADRAQPAGADDDAGNLQQALSGTVATVRTVTITAPGAGLIVVIASGNFSMDTLSGATCGINTDDTIDFAYGIQGFHPSGTSGIMVMPFGATRVFEVAAGDNTVNLNCYEPTGTSSIIDPSLTALFVPNRY